MTDGDHHRGIVIRILFPIVVHIAYLLAWDYAIFFFGPHTRYRRTQINAGFARRYVQFESAEISVYLCPD
jgi:hypothetical protein